MKPKNATLTVALGAAFTASLTMGATAQAVGNPFATQILDRGYMVADAGNKMGDGKCGNMTNDKAGDGKCGGTKKDAAPAKAKSMEGKCAANTKEIAPSKAKDGKCGEAKCGANKKS